MLTQQFPSNAKINLMAIKPRLISNSGRIHTNNGDKSPVSRVDESALRQWINYHNKAPGGIKMLTEDQASVTNLKYIAPVGTSDTSS